MSSNLSSDSHQAQASWPAILTILLAELTAMLVTPSLIGGVLPELRGEKQAGAAASGDVVPGVVVVKFRPSSLRTGPSKVQGTAPELQAISPYGVTSLMRAFPAVVHLSEADVAAGKVDLSLIHFAEIPLSADPLEVAVQLAALPEVEYAEPKYMYRLAEVPNDSDYATFQQVYFDRMQVAAGWALQKGKPEVVIATVDGGTNWRHPDLAENIWVNPGEDLNHDGIFQPFGGPGGDFNGADDDRNGYTDDVIGWNFGKSTNDPRGFLAGNADHGTETASVFGAVTDNGFGMAGASWNCKIMPVCVSDRTMDLNVPNGFEGIEYASRMGAKVINCSWYRAGGSGTYQRWEQDVITAATQRGSLIVAAAGNNNLQNLDDKPYYPASYEHVLSVGATKGTSDEIAYFTNIGLSVTVFAPGMAIRGAKDDGSYGFDQGTSHAAPLVAGLAGLLFAAHPDWTPQQVAAQIRMTSDPIDGANPAFAGSLGHGRVNFRRALSEVHVGVVVEAKSISNPAGRAFFLEGDTVALGVKVRNVLGVAADNLTFAVEVDSALELLAPIQVPTRLEAGASDSITCLFRVSRLSQKRDTKIRLHWMANGNEQDAYMFKTTVYPGEGYWERQQSPSGVPLWSVHAVSGRVVWAAGITWGATIILRTVDGGENWTPARGDLPSEEGPVVVFALDSLHAWVGCYSGGIYATIDGGVSWRSQAYPLPKSTFIDGIFFSDAMHGCVVGELATTPGKFVVLQTSDGGTTWTHIRNEPVGAYDEFGWSTAFCRSKPQHFWFVSWFGGQLRSRIWRSDDGGGTWSSLVERIGSVNALAMRDDSVGILCSGNVKTSDPAFFGLTTNGGTTWQPLSNVLREKGTLAAYPSGSAKAWIAGQSTVAYSSNNGASWVEQPTSRVSGVFNAMSFSDPENGWIVTRSGEILRYRTRGEPVVPAVQSTVQPPLQAMLEQNFPNPFNPLTVIKYTVAGAGGSHPASGLAGGLGARNTRLVVYDLLGREVAVLVNERKAPGTYEVQFDGSGRASGVYFYRLQTGDFVQTRKLLMVK